MPCSLPQKRFTAFREVHYFCIYAVDLAKGARYLKNEFKDLLRSHSPRFDRWRLPKQHTTQWLAFREGIHGEDLISNSVNQNQSWSQVVMFGNFYGWQSYESFPTEKNTNIFFVGVSFWIISDRSGKETQSWLLCFIYTSRPFSINYSISKFNGHPSHWQGK